MNKTIGNALLWLMLFALIANGAINVPQSVSVISDKVGRIFVILISPSEDN